MISACLCIRTCNSELIKRREHRLKAFEKKHAKREIADFMARPYLTALLTRTVNSSRSQCFNTANALRAIVVATEGSKVDEASLHKRSLSLCRKKAFLQETLEKALAKLLTSIVSNLSRLCSAKCCAKSSRLSDPHLGYRNISKPPNQKNIKSFEKKSLQIVVPCQEGMSYKRDQMRGSWSTDCSVPWPGTWALPGRWPQNKGLWPRCFHPRFLAMMLSANRETALNPGQHGGGGSSGILILESEGLKRYKHVQTIQIKYRQIMYHTCQSV